MATRAWKLLSSSESAAAPASAPPLRFPPAAVPSAAASAEDDEEEGAEAACFAKLGTPLDRNHGFNGLHASGGPSVALDLVVKAWPL